MKLLGKFFFHLFADCGDPFKFGTVPDEMRPSRLLTTPCRGGSSVNIKCFDIHGPCIAADKTGQPYCSPPATEIVQANCRDRNSVAKRQERMTAGERIRPDDRPKRRHDRPPTRKEPSGGSRDGIASPPRTQPAAVHKSCEELTVQNTRARLRPRAAVRISKRSDVTEATPAAVGIDTW
jgi:hypothetical protein